MPREPEAIRITTATRSRNEDIAARQKRYLISMTIRTVCFVLGVVSLGHWFMWVFLVASFLLPTIAVVVANSSSPPDPGGPDYFEPDLSTRALSGPPRREI
jgi:uncharacterized ion transporter superfamily protein YfcC